MKMNLWKDYFRLRPIPGLQVYSFGSCKASQLSFHLISQKNNNHLQIGKKSILQKIAPQEYFKHWGFSFLYPLAIQNHQKNRSFPKSNSKVPEQTCEPSPCPGFMICNRRSEVLINGITINRLISIKTALRIYQNVVSYIFMVQEP